MDKEVEEAIVAAFADALNQVLEKVVVELQTNTLPMLETSYGEGAECRTSVEECITVVQRHKVSVDQFNVVYTKNGKEKT